MIVKEEQAVHMDPERGSRNRKKHSYFEMIMNKYESRSKELEERETDLRSRLDIIQSSFPMLMLWNMSQVMQGNEISRADVIAAVSNTILKGERQKSRGKTRDRPLTEPSPGRRNSSRLKEIEEEREKILQDWKEAENAWRMREEQLTSKVLALEYQTKPCEEEIMKFKQKEEKYKRKIRDLENELYGKDSYPEELDVTIVFEPTSGLTTYNATYQELPNPEDIRGVPSLKSGDLEAMRRLQDLFQSEKSLKKRINQMERKEKSYIESFMETDQMWSGLENPNNMQISRTTDREAMGPKYDDMDPVMNNFKVLESNEKKCLDQVRDLEMENNDLLTETNLLRVQLRSLQSQLDQKWNQVNKSTRRDVRKISQTTEDNTRDIMAAMQQVSYSRQKPRDSQNGSPSNCKCYLKEMLRINKQLKEENEKLKNQMRQKDQELGELKQFSEHAISAKVASGVFAKIGNLQAGGTPCDVCNICAGSCICEQEEPINAPDTIPTSSPVSPTKIETSLPTAPTTIDTSSPTPPPAPKSQRCCTTCCSNCSSACTCEKESPGAIVTPMKSESVSPKASVTKAASRTSPSQAPPAASNQLCIVCGACSGPPCICIEEEQAIEAEVVLPSAPVADAPPKAVSVTAAALKAPSVTEVAPKASLIAEVTPKTATNSNKPCTVCRVCEGVCICNRDNQTWKPRSMSANAASNANKPCKVCDVCEGVCICDKEEQAQQPQSDSPGTASNLPPGSSKPCYLCEVCEGATCICDKSQKPGIIPCTLCEVCSITRCVCEEKKPPSQKPGIIPCTLCEVCSITRCVCEEKKPASVSEKRYLPTSEERTPEDRRYLPTSEEQTPEGRRYLPTSEEQTPEGRRYLPTSEEQTPEERRYLPTSEEQTPVNEEGKQEVETSGQSPDTETTGNRQCKEKCWGGCRCGVLNGTAKPSGTLEAKKSPAKMSPSTEISQAIDVPPPTELSEDSPKATSGVPVTATSPSQQVVVSKKSCTCCPACLGPCACRKEVATDVLPDTAKAPVTSKASIPGAPVTSKASIPGVPVTPKASIPGAPVTPKASIPGALVTPKESSLKARVSTEKPCTFCLVCTGVCVCEGLSPPVKDAAAIPADIQKKPSIAKPSAQEEEDLWPTFIDAVCGIELEEDLMESPMTYGYIRKSFTETTLEAKKSKTSGGSAEKVSPPIEVSQPLDELEESPKTTLEEKKSAEFPESIIEKVTLPTEVSEEGPKVDAETSKPCLVCNICKDFCLCSAVQPLSESVLAKAPPCNKCTICAGTCVCEGKDEVKTESKTKIPITETTLSKHSLLKPAGAPPCTFCTICIGVCICDKKSATSISMLRPVKTEGATEAGEEPETEIAPEMGEKGDAVPEEVPEAALEKVPETVPEETPEAAPEEAPEAAPEEAPEAAPEEVPEAAPEETPETMPEEAPQAVPEEAPEVTPDTVPSEPEPEKEEPELSEPLTEEQPVAVTEASAGAAEPEASPLGDAAVEISGIGKDAPPLNVIISLTIPPCGCGDLCMCKEKRQPPDTVTEEVMPTEEKPTEIPVPEEKPTEVPEPEEKPTDVPPEETEPQGESTIPLSEIKPGELPPEGPESILGPVTETEPAAAGEELLVEEATMDARKPSKESMVDKKSLKSIQFQEEGYRPVTEPTKIDKDALCAVCTLCSGICTCNIQSGMPVSILGAAKETPTEKPGPISVLEPLETQKVETPVMPPAETIVAELSKRSSAAPCLSCQVCSGPCICDDDDIIVAVPKRIAADTVSLKSSEGQPAATEAPAEPVAELTEEPPVEPPDEPPVEPPEELPVEPLEEPSMEPPAEPLLEPPVEPPEETSAEPPPDLSEEVAPDSSLEPTSELPDKEPSDENPPEGIPPEKAPDHPAEEIPKSPEISSESPPKTASVCSGSILCFFGCRCRPQNIELESQGMHGPPLETEMLVRTEDIAVHEERIETSIKEEEPTTGAASVEETLAETTQPVTGEQIPAPEKTVEDLQLESQGMYGPPLETEMLVRTEDIAVHEERIETSIKEEEATTAAASVEETLAETTQPVTGQQIPAPEKTVEEDVSPTATEPSPVQETEVEQVPASEARITPPPAESVNIPETTSSASPLEKEDIWPRFQDAICGIELEEDLEASPMTYGSRPKGMLVEPDLKESMQPTTKEINIDLPSAEQVGIALPPATETEATTGKEINIDLPTTEQVGTAPPPATETETTPAKEINIDLPTATQVDTTLPPATETETTPANEINIDLPTAEQVGTALPPATEIETTPAQENAWTKFISDPPEIAKDMTVCTCVTPDSPCIAAARMKTLDIEGTKDTIVEVQSDETEELKQDLFPEGAVPIEEDTKPQTAAKADVSQAAAESIPVEETVAEEIPTLAGVAKEGEVVEKPVEDVPAAATEPSPAEEFGVKQVPTVEDVPLEEETVEKPVEKGVPPETTEPTPAQETEISYDEIWPTFIDNICGIELDSDLEESPMTCTTGPPFFRDTPSARESEEASAPESETAPAPDSEVAPASDSQAAPAPDSEAPTAPDSEVAHAPDSRAAPTPDSEAPTAPDSEEALTKEVKENLQPTVEELIKKDTSDASPVEQTTIAPEISLPEKEVKEVPEDRTEQLLAESLGKEITLDPVVAYADATPLDLQSALSSMEKKCRTKDQIITALATELKIRAENDAFEMILRNLCSESAHLPDSPRDFDRDQLCEFIRRPEGYTARPPAPHPEPLSAGALQVSNICPLTCPGPKQQICEGALSPLGLQVLRAIGADCLLLGWNNPPDANFTGYEIFVNGVMKSKVRSSNRNKTLLQNLDLHNKNIIMMYALTATGRSTEPACVVYPDPSVEVGVRITTSCHC